MKNKEKLLKRLQKTEQKGVFKDPKTGALIIKTPEREKIVDDVIHKKIPAIENNIKELDRKLDFIIEHIQNKK